MTTQTIYTVEISRDAAIWVARMRTGVKTHAEIEYNKLVNHQPHSVRGYHVRITRKHVAFDVIQECKL